MPLFGGLLLTHTQTSNSRELGMGGDGVEVERAARWINSWQGMYIKGEQRVRYAFDCPLAYNEEVDE